MSVFRNPRFAKELAYRTKHNYYSLFSLTPEKCTEKRLLLNENKRKMKAAGFVTEDYFEVSQLINSLVGLLILPQQEYFNEIKQDSHFYDLLVLSKCMDYGEAFYRNTYVFYDNNKNNFIPEFKNPSNILRHMRNAIAHNRIMIEPESTDGLNITHLRYRDACYFQGNPPRKHEFSEQVTRRRLDNEIVQMKKRPDVTVCEFDLRIGTYDLEAVLMEIADYLIAHET